MNKNMDTIAKKLVIDYMKETLKTDYPGMDAVIVWKCKTLQNWKYLCITNLRDGRYFELTYNGDKEVWYVDVYTKVAHQTVMNPR